MSCSLTCQGGHDGAHPPSHHTALMGRELWGHKPEYARSRADQHVFRFLCPLPVSCVCVPWNGHGKEDMRIRFGWCEPWGSWCFTLLCCAQNYQRAGMGNVGRAGFPLEDEVLSNLNILKCFRDEKCYFLNPEITF